MEGDLALSRQQTAMTCRWRSFSKADVELDHALVSGRSPGDAIFSRATDSLLRAPAIGEAFGEVGTRPGAVYRHRPSKVRSEPKPACRSGGRRLPHPPMSKMTTVKLLRVVHTQSDSVLASVVLPEYCISARLKKIYDTSPIHHNLAIQQTH